MPKITNSHATSYFEKQFNKLPQKLQKIAARKILIFEENPFHPGLNTHQLKGYLSLFWTFCINNKYRVMFRFLKDNEVIYYDINTHNIYR